MHVNHLLREKLMGRRENPQVTLISHEFTHSVTEIHTGAHTHTHTHIELAKKFIHVFL